MATDWGRLDLNLLVPLNALLLERNVTKAADRLVMGQPAMSAVLAKLRRHFNDPLLVRDGRAMVLTPFAESLRQPVQTALVAAREVLSSGRSFTPATDRRTFTFMAGDYVSGVLVLPALRGLSVDAPGVRVNVVPLRAELVELLRTGWCDVLFWPLQLQTPELLSFPHVPLFTDEFIAVADRDNDAVVEPLTAEALASTRAVQVNGVAGQRVVSEVKLSEQGLSQPSPVTVESFTLALQAVAGSDLVTLTPRHLFDRLGPALGLREVPLAIEAPKVTLAVFWHPRNMLAPAHQWMRERLLAVAARM
ncbi:LysR family transcriptional regulator [Umezawaea endophytica]|uniref:LysR family transcriptional regulator n=1 Tax=Umezawaea endophytica TaxID=1654476 RepID=A0A9X3ACZ7_9PSEU|nr:LysR family transcriptional regulator [Umezawaea endophytica]MCS7475592.1 LysR family transcriptional regulator [Umezawaea endophytica]